MWVQFILLLFLSHKGTVEIKYYYSVLLFLFKNIKPNKWSYLLPWWVESSPIKLNLPLTLIGLGIYNFTFELNSKIVVDIKFNCLHNVVSYFDLIINNCIRYKSYFVRTC
jgi:hypothetical protein